jgi:predicted short-subunit dehydrogenase-like oxidoreductase (DUF2520 family)
MNQNDLPFGVIGFGRVGSALAAALRQAGHPVAGVATRSAAGRERADVVLPGVAVLDAAELVRRAALILVTVPDDQIENVVTSLASEWLPGQIVAHTAGVKGVEALAAVSQAGGIALAIHPAMTFGGTSLDVSRLRATPFGIDAPPGLGPLAEALVLELGGVPFILPKAARPAYHAALTHAANHLVTLIGQASQLLRQAGIAKPQEVLGPLTRASLDSALDNGFGALTGPAARGDAATLARHISAVIEYAAIDLPDDSVAGSSGTQVAVASSVVASYRTMALATVDAAVATGRIDQSQAREARRALQINSALASGQAEAINDGDTV